MAGLDLKIDPAMQLDSFDLVITLAALGMGIGFVPIRTLPLYGRKKSWRACDCRNVSSAKCLF
jgi:hypothetical protein